MNLKAALRGRKAEAVVEETTLATTERYPDFQAAYSELKRNLRRADGELQQLVREINLDSAGPMNAAKRREQYPMAIKAYKKAICQACDIAAAGLSAE